MRIKVVLHAPTEEALIRARSNAVNLLAATPDAQVEIVVNAAAVAPALKIKDTQTAPLLRICANTLRNKGLKPSDALIVVPSAVGHLVQRQAQGWAYIRA